MKTFGRTTSRSLRALIAVGALLAVAAPAGSVAADNHTQQVPLHNTDAPTLSGDDCPNAVDSFWHFIATPGSANFSFESITIVAGDPPTPYTFTGDQIIVNNNSNNVFVVVPDGVDPYSIQLDGSIAVISPATPEAQFVLSHYCVGTGTSTTTTTTVADTTTTTEVDTTTTTEVDTTTTTEVDTTTSTDATTSSSVAQLPPVGPTTTLLVTPTTGGSPEITPVLPSTGTDTAGQVAIVAAAVLGAGIAILAAARRRGTVEG